MPNEVVLAMYRPRPGQDQAVLGLIAEHVRSLRAWGFATDRPATLLRASDGTYIEIFEWLEGAAERAHHDERVMGIWNRFGAACEFGTMAQLPGATHPFPHFRAVDGVTV